MNILILGSGGREHALAWAVKQNPKCDRLIVAPGNAGIAMLAECAAIDILDGAAVVEFCDANTVDFVIVGPEAPLAAGVADACRAAGVLTFGPSAAAAQLEASKAFTKAVCDACGAPTAAYAHFTEAGAARDYVLRMGAPIVIKADGLAAGKGVVVAMSVPEALAALEDMFGGTLGAAGAQVVIEEFMTGEEASFFVLTDGVSALPIGSAQDHKRAFDGDTGPNTGGMGAYSPAPVLTDAIAARAMAEIILPTIAEMARRGTPYQGVLFAGLMIKGGQARLVEYNARFGDPECQVLAMRLGAQMLDLLLACAEGRLGAARVHWADDHALTVVMAAKGYPGPYAKGSVIGGLDALVEDSRNMVFHAGTGLMDGKVTAMGGRVLAVTARGDNLRDAQARAYAAVDAIDWPDGFCRRDIGWRAL
jgi:phosphoribosylamine---glycine ligase